MINKRYKIHLDEFERRILLNSLMGIRNRLLHEGKDVEPVNELILKIINTDAIASEMLDRLVRELTEDEWNAPAGDG